MLQPLPEIGILPPRPPRRLPVPRGSDQPDPLPSRGDELVISTPDGAALRWRIGENEPAVIAPPQARPRQVGPCVLQAWPVFRSPFLVVVVSGCWRWSLLVCLFVCSS